MSTLTSLMKHAALPLVAAAWPGLSLGFPLAPEHAVVYEGKDALGLDCRVEIDSDAEPSLSRIVLQGSFYRDGAIVRAWGQPGQYYSSTVTVQKPWADGVVAATGELPFGSGIFLELTEPLPPGVTGLKSKTIIKAFGTGLGELTGVEMWGGTLTLFTTSKCVGLRLISG